MVYKCKNCGAKLNVDKNAENVKCEYCESVNKIEFSMNDFYRNMSNRSKRYTKISSFFVIGMLIFGMSISLFMNKIATNNFSDEDKFYGIYKYNYYQDGGYLINNNDDGFLDIVTIALNIEDSENYLQIIDGKTGKRLKSIKLNKGKEPKLLVINKKYICISKEDFTITIYENKELLEIKTFSLSDKLKNYNFLNNKLYFETFDDNLWTINFPKLELRKGTFKMNLINRPSKFVHVSNASDESVTYFVKKKEKSSKNIFSVIAEKENIEIWNIPLGYEDVTWWDGPVIIVEGQNVITFGRKFTSDNLGYLIGIDKTDGRIKYEVQKSGKNCKLYDFYFNGRYIIANINGSFHAFNPNTGETKWMAGDVCK